MIYNINRKFLNYIKLRKKWKNPNSFYCKEIIKIREILEELVANANATTTLPPSATTTATTSSSSTFSYNYLTLR